MGVVMCGRGFVNHVLYYLDVGGRGIGELEPGHWRSLDVVLIR